MSMNKEAWGVEVGVQAIKVMKLAREGNGVVLEDFDVLPFKHVLTTPDLNVEEAIRVNLEALSQKHEFHKSHVVVSVPGHMAFARFAKLPPIEANKVKSIVAYEAQQQIPFPMDEVEWDYQVFAQEDAPDIEVGIFAITKERVANFLSNYRSVGMRVDTLTLSPVAVYNAFAFENEMGGHGDNTVYLDIGAVSTDIIVVEDGGIWLRTLPLGGNHFTNALMKQFKISFAKAEKLKLEAGTSKYAKQIFQAMRGVFSDLVTEIQRSLGFYTSLNRDSELTRIVGVGSTWKLPGLQKYLKQNLQMQVMRPDGYARLEVDGRRAAEFSSVAVNMATAYGLALQGLGISAVDANILPQSILRQRMWDAKRPWIGAAAACVAAAPIIGGAAFFMANSSFNSAWTPAKQEIAPTNAQAQAFKAEFDTLQTNDPRPLIRNYRRSFDYSNLYPKLMEDIASAMATIPKNDQIANADWSNPEDVARIAAIPRSERGLVWVVDIQTEYQAPEVIEVFDDGSGTSGVGEMPGGDGSAFDPEMGASAGELSPVPYPAATAPTPDPAADPSTVDPTAEQAPTGPPENAPRLIVTVTAQTTMDRATIARNLDRFVQTWLAENAQRPDRPYILVPDLFDRDYPTVGSMTTTDSLGGAGSTQGGLTAEPQRDPDAEPQETTPRPRPRPGGDFLDASPGLDSDLAVEVRTPENWYALIGQSSDGFSFDQIIPQRPLSYQPQTQDLLAVFKFEVILLSPDDARATILPAEDEEEPQTDNTTAMSPSQEDEA